MFGLTVDTTVAFALKKNVENVHGTIKGNVEERR